MPNMQLWLDLFNPTPFSTPKKGEITSPQRYSNTVRPPPGPGSYQGPRERVQKTLHDRRPRSPVGV
eukprot:341097-Amorphochlora_amoeboformis.AAC.3